MTHTQQIRRDWDLIEWNGKKHTAGEWAIITGINASTISRRIAEGMSVGKALTTPPMTIEPKLYEFKGEMLSVSEIAKRMGMTRDAIYHRVQTGKSLEAVPNYKIRYVIRKDGREIMRGTKPECRKAMQWTGGQFDHRRNRTKKGLKTAYTVEVDGEVSLSRSDGNG